LGVRALKRKWGKRTLKAFQIKASRVKQSLTKRGYLTPRVNVPNLYKGVEKRLLLRGFSEKDVHDILFGPKIKISQSDVQQIENLLSMSGMVNATFTVDNNTVRVVTKPVTQ